MRSEIRIRLSSLFSGLHKDAMAPVLEAFDIPDNATVIAWGSEKEERLTVPDWTRTFEDIRYTRFTANIDGVPTRVVMAEDLGDKHSPVSMYMRLA